MIDWFTTLCVLETVLSCYLMLFLFGFVRCTDHPMWLVKCRFHSPEKTVRRCRKFGSVDAAFLSMSVGSPTVLVMLWTFPWHRCDDQTGKDVYIYIIMYRIV